MSTANYIPMSIEQPGQPFSEPSKPENEAEFPITESYEPTPEEIAFAEKMLTATQRYLTKVREYAYAQLTPEQQLKRFEEDGDTDVYGSFMTIHDQKLGDVTVFIGAEDAGTEYYWQFYPRIFLAEDILKHPHTGALKVRKYAQALLYGGMGDDTKGQTLSRMRDYAEELLGGKETMSNLWINGMSQPPFNDYELKDKE